MIANQPFRLALPGVTVTDYDFSHQERMNGAVYPNHVAADQDREIMEGYALRLAEHLKDVPAPATAASPRALANCLDAGVARYVFVVNDARDYGPRFGRYKLRQELGVAQTVTLSVAIDGRPALYDALMRKPVKYREEQGRAVFDSALPAARGKLFVALPEEIAAVTLAAPETVKKGTAATLTIGVQGKTGNALAASLPLRVQVRDSLGRDTEWTRYTTTRRAADGTCVFVFTPALNDAGGAWTLTVEDLVSGATAAATVDVTD